MQRPANKANEPETPVPTTRLAPSPTGALHLGNARTFLVNWALARQNGWKVVLRIEDLDTPRVKPGVIEQTIRTLRWLGMDWDEQAPLQSADLTPYREAMSKLARAGRVFPCSLSRTEISEAAGAPHDGSGESRFDASLRPSDFPRSFDDEGTNWRLVVPAGDITFTDGFLGPQSVSPAKSVGDFVVWTQRSQPSYQLAVTIDDHRQGVTHVVRGSDLVDSAARQTLIRRALGIERDPAYTHLPLVRGEDGRRLAKRHGDTRIDHYRERGVPPERLIALIARWCGLPGRHEQLSASDFASGLSLDTMSREDVTFTPEDDRWLLDAASR
ncbi:MAG: glutamate--tRNA ligase family protein [Phycisphaerales bacterium JB061]